MWYVVKSTMHSNAFSSMQSFNTIKTLLSSTTENRQGFHMSLCGLELLVYFSRFRNRKLVEISQKLIYFHERIVYVCGSRDPLEKQKVTYPQLDKKRGVSLRLKPDRSPAQRIGPTKLENVAENHNRL